MASTWGALRRSTSLASKVSGTCDHLVCTTGPVRVTWFDTPIVIPLLSLRLEVDAGPSGDHVNDSAIRLIGEVFLLWCLGVILVVWVLVMRR
jgi:hypothetical protein